MVYLSGVAQQTQLFLYAFGFGFVLGVLYDVFRIIRLILSGGKSAVFVADILYLAVCTLLTFYFALVLNSGVLRGYILAGEILGWLVYYFSLGVIVVRISNRVISTCRKALSGFIRLLRRPIKFVVRKLRNCSKKITSKLTKINRKTYKKFKFHLQKRHSMLYNYLSYMRKNHNIKKKERFNGGGKSKK